MKRSARLVRVASLGAISSALMFATLAFAQATEDNGAPTGAPVPATPGTPSALLPQVQDLVLTPGIPYSIQCLNGLLGLNQSDPARADATCAGPTPRPTSTLVPTSTPAPMLINGVPLCDGQNGRPLHDPTRWHALVARDDAGVVICTYGHEHGMDPAGADDVFGSLPLAQQISYPWATVSSTGVLENGVPNKHRVYKWLVASSLACSLNDSVDGTSKMVTAFREELHADGNLGATIRFHSFWGEYQVTDCANPTDTGYISVGGHMDYAGLILGNPPVSVPLSTDPSAGCALNGDSRHEGFPGQPAQNGVWYGASARAQLAGQPACDDFNGDNALGAGVQVNVTTNSWGPVNPASPATLQFYADRQNYNGTHIVTDALTLGIGNGWLWQKAGYMDANGYINFTGHVNRHGAVVPEVAGKAEGLDYIPLVIRHAKPGAYATNGAAPCVGNLQHCPVSFTGDVAGPNGQMGYYVQTPVVN